MANHDRVSTVMRARWVMVLRRAWVALALAVLAIMAAALPIRLTLMEAHASAARQALVVGVNGLDVLLQLALLGGAYPVVVVGLEAMVMLAFVCAALLLWWRRADNGVVLFTATGLLCSGPYVAPGVEALAQAQPGWRTTIDITRSIGIYVAVMFFYVFPDGRFTPTWTRPLAALWTGWTLCWLVVPDMPLRLVYPYDAAPLAVVLLIACYGSGLLAQWRRHRQIESAVARQQTKWVVFGVMTAFLSCTALRVSGAVVGMVDDATLTLTYDLLAMPVHLLMMVITPCAFVFAILRHRLWEIDLIINRALTGQQSELAIIASTLIGAALFHPLRHRLQRLIDRRFYRRKYGAALALAAFGQRLRDDVTLVRVADDLLMVVRDTVQPRSLSLWLRPVAPRAPGDDRHVRAPLSPAEGERSR